MPEVPMTINGVTRMVWVQPLTEDTWQSTQHQYRRIGVMVRRSYFEGTQYEMDNLETKKALYPGDSSTKLLTKRLPEHKRKHNYAGWVKENVKFLSNQITGAMNVRATTDSTDQWIDMLLEDIDIKTLKSELAREMIVAGDYMVQFRPDRTRSVTDPELPAVKVDFWQSEDVEIDYDENDWKKMTEVRYERVVHVETADGMDEERRYVHAFRMELRIYPDGEVREECRETVTDTEDDIVIRRTWLGLPFIPWVHVPNEPIELRSMWGRSLISQDLMETIDRYNATCHLEFLSLRYNAHGNLAVVGDAALLQNQQGTEIRKDIADVLTFPGGTGVSALQLSIDTEAYREQKSTLQMEAYQLMGLTRIDDDSLRSFGQVSGYALEILNRKTDGTFTALSEHFGDGLIKIIEMSMDVDAYARATRAEDEDGDQYWEFWLVDPEAKHPDREIEVEFGSAYIVDEVAIRDDFVAGLISQREALRKRGYTDEEIDQIIEERQEQADEDEARLASTLTQGSRFSSERQ